MVNVPNSSVPIASQFAPGVPWFQFFNDLKREVDGKYDAADISSGWQTALAQTPTGIYTPTLTIVANLDAVTAASSPYLRVGDYCFVWCRFDANPTVGGATITQLGISLPVASALTSSAQVIGHVTTPNETGSGSVFGDATNDRANAYWGTSRTTNTQYQALFGYFIL